MIIHDPSRIEDKETWNHATINQFLTAFWKGHKFPLRSASLEEVQVSFPANSLKRSTPWFHFLGFLCLPVSCLSREHWVTALWSVLLWQRVSIAFLLVVPWWRRMTTVSLPCRLTLWSQGCSVHCCGWWSSSQTVPRTRAVICAICK